MSSVDTGNWTTEQIVGSWFLEALGVCWGDEACLEGWEMGAGSFEKCLENNLFPTPQSPQRHLLPYL